MAVMVVDHSEAEIGLGVRDRPEAIVGRGTVDKPVDRPLGLDAFGVDRGIPEPHRFRVGEALVHRVHIFVAELAQAEATGNEGRVRRGVLHHINDANLKRVGPRGTTHRGQYARLDGRSGGIRTHDP